MATDQEVAEWQEKHASLADILDTLYGAGGGGLKVTRVSVDVPSIPINDTPAPGDGLTIYTPVAGELMAFWNSGISIAPGDEFDGDYQISVWVDGQQANSEFASCFAGDVDAFDDGGGDFDSFGVAGFWKMARPLGNYPAGSPAPAGFFDNRFYFVDDSPLKILLTNGPGVAPTVGVVTFVICTIP